MNKHIILYTTISFLLLSCRTSEKTIEINQLKTNYEIVVLLNKEHKKIALIEFPVKIKLKNNSISEKSFSSINYKYFPYEKGIGVPLYVEQNDKLIRIKQSKKKEIQSKGIQEYIIYTRHRVDTSRSIQKSFNSYIDKMISSNLDTLTIGTVDEFKKSNRKILDILTDKDSISVDMWNAKNIVVPVAW